MEITEENASELSRHKGNLRLSSVKSLTEKTAELLSGTQGQLILSGLAEIGDTESHAKLFGKLLENQGEFELKNLKNLSSKAAAFLPLRTGSYIFPNLNQIDDETAGFFGRIPGNGRLLLDGLKELSPSAATALGQFQGFCLSLDGLKALSREAASGLANFGGSILSLKGLNPQSLEVRIISDSYQGRLNIQHTLPED